jgi:hypothetical protein
MRISAHWDAYVSNFIQTPTVLGHSIHNNSGGDDPDKASASSGVAPMSNEFLQYRILPNNSSGWYWEVVTPDREVIARGLAETHAQARTDAMHAAAARGVQFKIP